MLVTGVEGLYVWCRRITGGYKGVEVTNMTEAWRNGLAFCAIIHRFRPDLIDFDSLEENDPSGNCELAFRIAEKELGIPSLLDPNDMADCPSIDKLSILTYLAQFYHKFSGTAPQTTTRGSRSNTDSLTSVSSRISAVPSNSSSSSSASDVSTDSGLEQSSGELSSASSRVSSVSPISNTRDSRQSPVNYRGILKPRDSDINKLEKKKEYSKSFESLLDIYATCPNKKDQPSSNANSSQISSKDSAATESSFKAAFKKFSTLSCSSSNLKASPPKPARHHALATRSVSSSMVTPSKMESREVQTEERLPVLVSQVTQTEDSHLSGDNNERRRKTHRRQASTSVPRGHYFEAEHPTTTRGGGVPNCDRNRQSRLLSGIASYGHLDRFFGRSSENISSTNHHHRSPPQIMGNRQQMLIGQFTRTHSTLV